MSWKYHGKTLIKANPEEIYPYISTVDGFKKWFLRNCKLDTNKGGNFHITWGDGNTAQGSVVELIENERFSFEWDFPNLDLTTRIDIWLEPTDNGTLFHIEEGEFPEQLDAVKHLNSITQGWTLFVSNMKSVVMYGKDLRNDWD